MKFRGGVFLGEIRPKDGVLESLIEIKYIH